MGIQINPEFEECLKRDKIREFSRGRALVGKELISAEEDLQAAAESFRNEKYKWCAIQSYYSMFHSARALLYAKNYREKSHYCLSVAIQSLYVETKLLPLSLLESLRKGKRLREDADYYNRWSPEGAESSFKSAKDFFEKAKALTNVLTSGLKQDR